MKYGIAHTVNDSPTGNIIGWKRNKAGIDQTWNTYAQALEFNDLDGWRGYVREYPSGDIVPQGRLDEES